MKKFLSVICACALMAGLTACGNSETGTETSTESKPESSAAESSADETPATEESEETPATEEVTTEDSEEISEETAEYSEEETEEDADEISEADKVEESNKLAATIKNAANTALVDLDVSGTDTKSFDGYQYCIPDGESSDIDGLAIDIIDEKLLDAMKYYCDIYNNEFVLYIEDGVCVCTAVNLDGYCGSYPVISENESEYDDTLDLVSALELAVSSVDEEQR